MFKEVKVAIMQPTYFPWCGYFELVNSVDKFVVLDDVPLAKQRPNWQKENRILSSHGVRWLKVPTVRPNGVDSLIKDVLVDDSKEWKCKHLSLIHDSYGKAVFFDDFFPRIEASLRESGEGIACINMNLIVSICEYLDIKAEFIRSSDISGLSGVKQERILNICSAVGGEHYYSPEGARDYMCQKDFVSRNIELTFQNYAHPEYNQFNNRADFVSHLSVVDLIFNYGKDAKEIMLSGVQG